MYYQPECYCMQFDKAVHGHINGWYRHQWWAHLRSDFNFLSYRSHKNTMHSFLRIKLYKSYYSSVTEEKGFITKNSLITITNVLPNKNCTLQHNVWNEISHWSSTSMQLLIASFCSKSFSETVWFPQSVEHKSVG